MLRLYALPSLDRQMDLERIALYENDITMLLARHRPQTEPLLAMITPHVMPTDMRELVKIAAECSARANRLRERAGSA